MDLKDKIKKLNDELLLCANGFGTGDIEKTTVNCPSHGEFTQFFRSINANGKTFLTQKTRCPACVKDELCKAEDALSAYRDGLKESTIKQLIEDSNIPKRFFSARFDNYNPVNQDASKALKICKAYADKWPDRLTQGGGLVMVGSPGTGKNHLAISIARQVIEQHQNSVLITSVSKIIRAFRRTWGKDSDMNENEVINIYLDYDLLIIDEVGVQYGSDSEKVILFEIINSRYEQMKPTILISNETKERLTDYVGERILDRMKEGGGCDVIFNWESYRSRV